MLTVATVLLLVTLLLILARALIGPSLYDRILALNLFGNTAVLLIAVYACVSGRGELLDIAIAYALVSFIGVIALLRFFSFRTEQGAETRD